MIPAIVEAAKIIDKFYHYPALFTKTFSCGQGVSEMVAETYLSTLSKPFLRQRSPRVNVVVTETTLNEMSIVY